jgi:hypothetical protein
LGSDETVEEAVPDVPEPDASDRLPDTSVAQSRPAPHVPAAPWRSLSNQAFRPAAPDSSNSISAGENRNTGF